MISGSVDSVGSAVMAFAIGGVGNVFARGLSDIAKYFDAVSAKAHHIANMSSKRKSLTIWKMMGTDKFMRNSYKGWCYEHVFDLLMEQPIAKLGIESLNNMPRYMIYSSAASSLLSGWY